MVNLVRVATPRGLTRLRQSPGMPLAKAFHLAQGRLEGRKPADRVKLAIIRQFVDVRMVPAMGTMDYPGLDPLGHSGDELHSTSGRIHRNRVAVDNPAGFRIARM